MPLTQITGNLVIIPRKAEELVSQGLHILGIEKFFEALALFLARSTLGLGSTMLTVCTVPCQSLTPDHGERHLMLAEPTVLRIRTVTVTGNPVCLYPHTGFVEMGAEHLGPQGGLGIRGFVGNLDCVGMRIRLGTREDARRAGLNQGGITDGLQPFGGPGFFGFGFDFGRRHIRKRAVAE